MKEKLLSGFIVGLIAVVLTWVFSRFIYGFEYSYLYLVLMFLFIMIGWILLYPRLMNSDKKN